MKNVFVYGTLKKGGRFHPALEGSEFLGEKVLDGYRMYDYAGSYPIVVKGNKGEKIKGEVYRVSASVESILDQIEGYPHLYQKHTDGNNMLYIMENEEKVKQIATPIKEGVWHN